MVTTLKQGANKKSIQKVLDIIKKESKPKGIDSYKYLGKIKFTKDPVEIQKAIRNEWD